MDAFTRLLLTITIPLLFLLAAPASYSQIKKVPAYINGKLDTLDFPNDFRNDNGIPIGEELPRFKLADINGDTIATDNYRDKLLVLNFWFVGCVGCKQEEPNLRLLTERLKDSKVDFVSICQSTPRRTKAYLKKHGDFGYKVISMKAKADVYNLFGVAKFTTHFIVRNGIVVENISFPLTTDDEIAWFEERIRQELAKL